MTSPSFMSWNDSVIVVRALNITPKSDWSLETLFLDRVLLGKITVTVYSLPFSCAELWVRDHTTVLGMAKCGNVSPSCWCGKVCRKSEWKCGIEGKRRRLKESGQHQETWTCGRRGTLGFGFDLVLWGMRFSWWGVQGLTQTHIHHQLSRDSPRRLSSPDHQSLWSVENASLPKMLWDYCSHHH